jgi:hypothetical protein
VTLGRIFSCFHDRDHVHSDIHANSYTGSYAKHAIHPPKISTPTFKEISLLVILRKERGVIEKNICSRSIQKREKESTTQSKKRISKQGVLRKQTKIFHTHAHLNQVA